MTNLVQQLYALSDQGIVKQWITADKPFTCRFGLEMLTVNYLEQNFEPEFLEYPLAITLTVSEGAAV